MTKKRLAWRCKDTQQQRDKAEIYNSKEWKRLREAKLLAQPLCERCLEMGKAACVRGGWIRSAHCVHHIIPIETATTKQEMWQLAVGCGLSGLMSLCDRCHAEIHNHDGYHTKEAVKARKESAFERWKAKQEGRTATDAE